MRCRRTAAYEPKGECLMSDLPIVAPGYEPEEAPERENLEGVLCNRCVLDEKTLREAMDAAMRTNPALRVGRILEPILAVLALGLLILAAVTRAGLTAILLNAFLLLMLTYFYLQQFVIYPRRAVKNQLLRQARDDGTLTLENRLFFREENVANLRGEADEPLHMPWSKIKSAAASGRLIVLTTKSKNVIPLDRKGFSEGTEEDFWRLLRRHAPQAKIRK